VVGFLPFVVINSLASLLVKEFLKIDQSLAKLWAKIVAPFYGHGVNVALRLLQ